MSDQKHDIEGKVQEGKLQGEGDYDAAQRYRENVTDFVKKADIEELAKKAQPSSTKEGDELAQAAKRGRARSKGDDPADAAIMQTRKNKGEA